MPNSLFAMEMILMALALFIGPYSCGTATSRNGHSHDCKLGEEYPHPDNCHQFYTCTAIEEDTKVTMHTCTEGTFFEPILGLCVPEDPQNLCQLDLDALEDFRMLTRIGDDPCKSGDNPKCENCTTYAYCNTFTSTWMYGTCTGDTPFCDAEKAKCSADVPSCIPFQCGKEGIYPDVYDCTKYHVCDKSGKDTQKTCTNGKAFNQVSMLCDAEMDDDCTKAIASCEDHPSSLKKLPVDGDCLLYYNCEVSKQYPDSLVPVFSKCDQGQYFNEGNAKCLSIASEDNPPDLTCALLLTESGIHCVYSGWNAADTCPTVAYFCNDKLKELGKISCPDGQAFDIVSTEPNCKEYSQIETCSDLCKEDTTKKQNPSDCTTYFECKEKGGMPKVAKCPDGQAFNDAIGECDAMSNVPLCQSGNVPTSTAATSTSSLTTAISSSSTLNTGSTLTTPSGFTSPNTGSTATASPSSGSTSTNTATTAGSTSFTSQPTSPTPPPFKCTRTGFFPITSGCSDQYYRCYKSGGIWHKVVLTCPNGFIFNNELSRCVKGSCPSSTTTSTIS